MLAPREPFARTLAEEADQREEEALVEDAEALMHTEAPQLLHALDLLLYRCMDALGGTSRSQRPSSATPDADSPTPPVETPRQPQSAASGVLGGSTRPAAAPASPLSASKIVVDHIRLDTASKGRIQGYLQVHGSKIVRGEIVAEMDKLSAPLRTGIGPSFPWVLPQVQAARNHLLNACAALNQWRRTFSLEVLPFVEECEPALEVLLNELDHARAQILLPAEQAFPLSQGSSPRVLQPMPPSHVAVDFTVMRAALQLRIAVLADGATGGAAVARKGHGSTKAADSLLNECFDYHGKWVRVVDEERLSFPLPTLERVLRSLDAAHAHVRHFRGNVRALLSV